MARFYFKERCLVIIYWSPTVSGCSTLTSTKEIIWLKHCKDLQCGHTPAGRGQPPWRALFISLWSTLFSFRQRFIQFKKLLKTITLQIIAVWIIVSQDSKQIFVEITLYWCITFFSFLFHCLLRFTRTNFVKNVTMKLKTNTFWNHAHNVHQYIIT